MIDIQYNNVLASDLKIYMKGKPTIPAAQEEVKEVSIPGRDGALAIHKKSYKSTSIQIEFNYIGRVDQWGERWRAAKKWLSATNGELKFSDDPEIFYKICRVEVGENSKKGERIGDFSAVFITKDGLSYLESGKEEIKLEDKIYNPGMFSKPIYRITGEGVCTLMVNGKEFTANISQNLTIDAEKMIAYREDGSLVNASVKGDYEDLYLQAGENILSITDGFECKIIPRWRCL